MSLCIKPCLDHINRRNRWQSFTGSLSSKHFIRHLGIFRIVNYKRVISIHLKRNFLLYMQITGFCSYIFSVSLVVGTLSWQGRTCLDDLVSYAVWAFHIPSRATQAGHVVSQKPNKDQIILIFFKKCCLFLFVVVSTLLLLLIIFDIFLGFAVVNVQTLMCTSIYAFSL